MFYLDWLLILIYTLVVMAIIITVVLENRQPAKTMAWILVLVFLPIVGIVWYFFFGQNTRKERMISQRDMDELTKRSMLEFVEQRNLNVPLQYKPLATLFANQSMALPFKDNQTEIYTNGYDFFLQLIKSLGHAKHHIHLISYIIAHDALGKLIGDVLIDKAKQGVEVRLIVDDVGSWTLPNSFFDRLKKAGVEVHTFLPVYFPAFTSKVNYRNHHKLCVVDGKIGYIGGMNIAMRYLRGTSKQAWRDTHLQVCGGAVYAIQRAFLMDWYFVNRMLISHAEYYPPIQQNLQNDCIAQVVTSSPASPWPDIMQGYIRILVEARHYVYMETPYFLPTENVRFALQTAALAGVDVRLMIPLHGDAKLPEWASRSYIPSMLEAGVKVYMYKAGFNHSKLLVCDDYISTCGSTNIDFRSFENNFESNIFFYDREMALRFKTIFLADQAQCTLADNLKEFNARPILMRLWESLVRLLSPLM